MKLFYQNIVDDIKAIKTTKYIALRELTRKIKKS